MDTIKAIAGELLADTIETELMEMLRDEGDADSEPNPIALRLQEARETINSFSALHDICDANMLGQTEKVWTLAQASGIEGLETDIVNIAQSEINRRLKLGLLRYAHVGDPTIYQPDQAPPAKAIALPAQEKPATEPVSSRDALVKALTDLVKWMDDSNLSHVPKGGVHPFTYGGDEYSVVTDARKALDAYKPPPVANLSEMAGGENFLIECPHCKEKGEAGDVRHIDTATTMRDVIKVDALGDGNYIVTMEGCAVIDIESSRDDRFECCHCCAQFSIPENVELRYE